MYSVTRWSGELQFSAPDEILVASSNAKDIVMSISTGQMYSRSSSNHLVATPCRSGIHEEIVSGCRVQMPVDHADGKDSILRWFEEHANRLNRDYLSIGTMIPDGHWNSSSTLSLLKFPTVSDKVHCSRAVTRGIEVVASAIFCEEFVPQAMFVYSIRMRLLTPDDGEEYMSPDQRGFRTCQLISRHWKICKHSPHRLEPKVEEVRGEGVTGYYPLLYEGGYMNYHSTEDGFECLGDYSCPEFKYQSCTDADEEGTMEGYLQFGPISEEGEPPGSDFNVRVAPFPLEKSHFLY